MNKVFEQEGLDKTTQSLLSFVSEDPDLTGYQNGSKYFIANVINFIFETNVLLKTTS